jgi:hypothetical protein
MNSIRLLLSLVVGGFSAALHAAPKPLQVFILAGQSNMQGHAELSTLDSLADDPKTAPWLKDYDESQGFELAGFACFEGFNELVSDWTYGKGMEPGG